MLRHAHKIGAGFYILWGILHIWVGWEVFSLVSSESPQDVYAFLGSGLPTDQHPQNVSTVVESLAQQYAFNLLWIGAVAAIIGGWLNYRNDEIGYWVNLILVTLVDIGFILYFVLPGVIKLEHGIGGPILWILAVIFSTLGYRAGKKESIPSAV